MQTYQTKFSGLIESLEHIKETGAALLIPRPETLGDDYAEIMESLTRIAAVGIPLLIIPRGQTPPPNPGGLPVLPRRLAEIGRSYEEVVRSLNQIAEQGAGVSLLP